MRVEEEDQEVAERGRRSGSTSNSRPRRPRLRWPRSRSSRMDRSRGLPGRSSKNMIKELVDEHQHPVAIPGQREDLILGGGRSDTVSTHILTA